MTAGPEPAEAMPETGPIMYFSCVLLCCGNLHVLVAVVQFSAVKNILQQIIAKNCTLM
jgi:hypothetical protein